MPSRNRTLLACLVLAAAVLLAYCGAWRCGFVDYDDNTHVFENPHITSGLSGENIRWAFGQFNGAQWIPLTWLSFMLDASLFGLNPGAMHVVNVLFHLANTLLLFALLRRMTGAFWRSFAVAALFGLHPVNVESVAWIAERKNVLSTFFWLLATLAYVRHAARPRVLPMVLVAALLACGLMVKAMLVTLPCTLLLLDFWPLARWRTEKWTRLTVEMIPLFALSAVACWLQIRAAQHDNLLWSASALQPGYQGFNALANVVRYLGLLAFPADLAPMYTLPARTPVFMGLLGAGLIAVLLTAGIALRKRTPALLVGTLWFLGTQVPVSGLVSAGDAVLCDRYLYVPGIGVFVAAVWSVAALRVRWRPALVVPVAGCAAVVLGALTFLQVGHWQNSRALFTHAAEVSPGSIVARKHAGWILEREGRLAAARAQYEAALALAPDLSDARCSLGIVLARMGRHSEAIAEFRRVLIEQPADSDARVNLGTQLLAAGEIAESASVLGEAVARNPGDPVARHWLERARVAAAENHAH
jgi:tetratricopeptide (TPR) repeat protein